MTDRKPTFVTQPFLPPLEELVPFLESIWESRILTNGGPFHKQFEEALSAYLGVEHLSLFTNGTIALITALQALRVKGEVITTPYSFVATGHALLWNGIRPVFVDVDPVSLNLDPSRIEAAITPRTTAILPVHCYGRPCDVDKIQRVADAYNLKVIYDAAHGFGARYRGISIAAHGDLSVLSFHATKVFNTFEGGAIVCRDAKTKQHIDHLKNFGFVGETSVVAAGINGKMDEFRAALGILQLRYADTTIALRRRVADAYRARLAGKPGIRLFESGPDEEYNFAYFPVLFGPESRVTRDQVYTRLHDAGIHARRYFFPLISEFPMYRGLASANSENLPVATAMTRQVICLPMFPDLQREVLTRICDIVLS